MVVFKNLMTKYKAKFVSKDMTHEQYRKFCNTEHGLNSYMVDYLKESKKAFRVSVFEEDEKKFNDLIVALNF